MDGSSKLSMEISDAGADAPPAPSSTGEERLSRFPRQGEDSPRAAYHADVFHAQVHVAGDSSLSSVPLSHSELKFAGGDDHVTVLPDRGVEARLVAVRVVALRKVDVPEADKVP